MAVMAYNDWLRKQLAGVECVLAFDTAADYLGLTNGGYRDVVQIFVSEKQNIKGMDKSNFQKSDMGAQAAWKGFSSQTYYIAARLISDEQGYEYYPEDIEDLVVKKNGIIVEAVQIKNISTALTLSSLALAKTSKGGEGFLTVCVVYMRRTLFLIILGLPTLGP